ncbi:MAG: TetR family transcriptional regulator [Actinomycetota bacterium]
MRARTDSGHEAMIRAALDAAADEVCDRGWSGLQMRAVAHRIGVSRQTLYNTFTNKDVLAQALVLRLNERYLRGVENALASGDDVRSQWFAAIYYTLEAAATDPLLKTVLTADGRGELLPLLTSGAEPIIQAARDRLAEAILRAGPGVAAKDARDAAETATRLAISHIVLPLHPTERAAALIADVVDRFVRIDNQK